MQISLIAAMTKNRVIGIGNRLPWKITNELQYFRKVTINKPIIMGSKTFLGLGKIPLAQRSNIVLTKTPDQFHDLSLKYTNLIFVNNLQDSLKVATDQIAANNYLAEIMVIGGSEIYKLFLPVANKLYLSILHQDYPGDVFFPIYEENTWQLQEVQEYLEFRAEIWVRQL